MKLAEQVEVAVALIEGRDVFAILHTGFAVKILCYMLACHSHCSFHYSGHHERPGTIRKWLLYS